MRRRVNIITAGFMAGVVVLVGSLTNIQIFNHEKYKEAAVNQQTKNTIIAPTRGAILDRNGTVLAESQSAVDVLIDPKALDEWVEKYYDTKKISKEDVCRTLANILDMDYETVYAAATKTRDDGTYRRSDYLKKKVSMETANQVEAYMQENSIAFLRLDETSKRTYPNGNFAAHILGYVNVDNKGMAGIEAQYDDVLRGLAGSVVAARNSRGELPYAYDKYVAAENGANVVLTIDEVIQHYLEKYLEEARVQNNLRGKATGIIMDVNTGAILAMAVKGDYDPNDPSAIPEEVQAEAEQLPEEEQQQYLSDYLYQIWRNFAISDTYEPGSVYKTITASAALEEGVATLNSTYTCYGARSITLPDGRKIGCWTSVGHGTENFTQALMNSCNPALMQMGLGLGRDLFYKYQQAFGFGEKTGIDLIGETNSVLHSLGQLNEVQLMTSSFGQTFKVTPIQMITALSAIANGGTLYQPYLVQELRNPEDNSLIERYDPVERRQVISEETSDIMCSVLEQVVSSGTGKNAYITGFRVAGKTGTSEKRDTADEYDRVASFGGFAPANDPQVACIIILDDPPDRNNNGGGAIAAPVFRKVMEDTLTYLKVTPQYKDSEKSEISAQIQDVTGKSRAEAQAIMKDNNFTCQIIGSGDTIVSQLPKGGASMPMSATIYLFTEEANNTLVDIPNVVGMSPTQASQTLKNAKLNVKLSGPTESTARVISQSLSADSGKVDIGTLITVELASNTNIGD